MRLTLFLLLLAASFNASTQTLGDFRSASSGPWDVVANWEIYNGTSWAPASAAPTAADNVISIEAGHSITIPNGLTVNVDQLSMSGNLTVNSGGSLILVNGVGSDLVIGAASSVLTVNGMFDRKNLSTIVNTFGAANILFGPGSGYYHNFTTSLGDLPPATWNPTSTVFFTGFANTLVATANASWNQTFGNIVFNSPAQSGMIDFAGHLTTIKGNLSVLNTGGDIIQFSGSENLTLSIGELNSAVGGDVTISGNARVNFSKSGAVVVNIFGDFNFTGANSYGTHLTYTGSTVLNIHGNFSMDTTPNGKLRFASTGSTGNGTINLYQDFSLISGRIDETGSNPTQGNIRFVGSGTQNFINTGLIIGYINYYVGPTSTVNLSIYSVTGSPSSFVQDGTIVVGSSDPLGAINTGVTTGNIRTPFASRKFNPGATIIYNGPSKQFVGSGHPGGAGITTVIDNPNGVDLVSNITVGGVLRLESGILGLNDFRLTSLGTLETSSGQFAGSPLSSIFIQGTGDGNWGTLAFSPSANSLGLLSLSRSGNNASVVVSTSLVIASALVLDRGTLVNNSVLSMEDNSNLYRFENGFLSGNALISNGSYHVTYRTTSLAGGPFAIITTGSELPGDESSLGNLTISCAQNNDQVVLSQNLFINKIFTLNKGSFAQGQYNVTMRGINWNDNSGTFVGGAGTVIFDADSTRIFGSTNPIFGNIRINAAKKADFARNFVVQGSIDFVPGSEFDMHSFTMTLAGATPQQISASGATFANITVSKSNSQGVVLTSRLDLIGLLQIVGPSTNVNFQSGGHLYLRSSSDAAGALNTASIGRLVNSNRVTGIVTVERRISSEVTHYRYISSPITDATVAQLKDDFPVQGNFVDPSPTQKICGSTASSTGISMYWYDERVAGDPNAGYTAYPAPGTTAAESPLVVGRGYSVYIRQCGTPTLIDYVGPVNQGTMNLPVTFTPNDPSGQGWNLVGNPYPSTIDWDISGWTKRNIASVIAIIDNAAGMTRYYEAGVTENQLPNGYIASGQGFFVLANGTNPLLTIRETVKTNSVGEYFRERPQFVPSMVVSLSDGKNTDWSYVKTISGALPTLDTMDAPKILNPNFSLSTMSIDNHAMAINALRELTCGSPLILKADGLIPGEYSIALDTRQFYENYSFVLVDKFAGKQVSIKDSRYAFTVTNDSLSAASDRFLIMIDSQAPSLDFAVTAPAFACEPINNVTLSATDRSTLYSVWSANGARLTSDFAGSGSSLTIPVLADSLMDGSNELKIFANAGCAAIPAASFSIVKSSALSFDVATKLNCSAGTNLFIAEGASDASFLWFAAPEGGKPLFEGKEFETPVLVKDETFFVSAKDNNTGCISGRVAVKATRPDVLHAEILVDGMTLTSSVDEGNQWYLNGVLLEGKNASKLEMTEAGLYELFVNQNGCVVSASYLLEEIEIPGIRFYPNPVSDQLKIEGIDENVKRIDLTNTVGQDLGTVYRKGEKFDGEISLGSVPDGLYLLIVEKGDRKYSYRLFKRAK